jgi:DNA-binding MarR family transcriptional regulator
VTIAAAIAEVEEQMTVLAGLVRANIRDTALCIDPTLQPFGLKVLLHLARYGPTHASGVAEALSVDRSVISRQAAQLHELGLVDVQADPNDGRARFLALTPSAAQRLAEARASTSAGIHRRLGSWSEGELRQFAALLAKLNTP